MVCITYYLIHGMRIYKLAKQKYQKSLLISCLVCFELIKSITLNLLNNHSIRGRIRHGLKQSTNEQQTETGPAFSMSVYTVTGIQPVYGFYLFCMYARSCTFWTWYRLWHWKLLETLHCKEKLVNSLMQVSFGSYSLQKIYFPHQWLITLKLT